MLRQKALFGLLHTHCFNKSLSSYPEVILTRKTMSEEMGVSEVTIRSWIKELEKAFCLEVIRQGYKKPISINTIDDTESGSAGHAVLKGISWF